MESILCPGENSDSESSEFGKKRFTLLIAVNCRMGASIYPLAVAI